MQVVDGNSQFNITEYGNGIAEYSHLHIGKQANKILLVGFNQSFIACSSSVNLH